VKSGVPGGIRTPNLLTRSNLAETLTLRAQGYELHIGRSMVITTDIESVAFVGGASLQRGQILAEMSC
jgi:hypothetical protein